MITIISALAILLCYLFISSSWNKNYWKRKSIPQVSPSLVRKWARRHYPKSLRPRTEGCTYNYFKSEGIPVGGTYEALSSPVLYVTDFPLLRKIMTEDSLNHFVDRRELYEPKLNPLFGRMLSFQKGEEWKRLRAVVTPSFNSNKIRGLEPIFSAKCFQLIEAINNKIETGESRIKIHELFGRLTMSVISSTAFGTETESLAKEDCPFYKMGTRIQELTLSILFRRIMAKYFPRIAEFFKLSTFDTSALKFFADHVKKVVRMRLKGDTARRNDFLDSLLKSGLAQEEIVSQAVMVYILGFDPMNTLLDNLCVVLAQNEDLQEELRNELKPFYDKDERLICYENVAKLVIMDSVFAETLRLYPPSTRTERRCTKEYEIPGSLLIIPNNSQIIIPIHAIHTNPEYWENPDAFDHTRFVSQGKNPAFLPFGLGPRMCLGQKFALTFCKMAVASLLANFKISVCPQPGQQKENACNLIRSRDGTFKPKANTLLEFTRIR